LRANFGGATGEKGSGGQHFLNHAEGNEEIIKKKNFVKSLLFEISEKRMLQSLIARDSFPGIERQALENHIVQPEHLFLFIPAHIGEKIE
jgi:hypothetical protein